MMDKTEYVIKLVKIWNTSEDRQEAFRRAKTLDGKLTYKKMMNKINYIRNSRFIKLRPVPTGCHGTDWAAVKKAAEY
jgi:hypothetical protein|tara:strand:- start:368 stop:598 length:231 start_codon:yes stop_codon:yes gene_type:complete